MGRCFFLLLLALRPPADLVFCFSFSNQPNFLRPTLPGKMDTLTVPQLRDGFSRSRMNSASSNVENEWVLLVFNLERTFFRIKLLVHPSSELARLEQEIFYRCKAEESDAKANSGHLLEVFLNYHSPLMKKYKELENMGIQRTDPRIRPLMKALNTYKRMSVSSVYGLDNIKLDFNQFTK